MVKRMLPANQATLADTIHGVAPYLSQTLVSASGLSRLDAYAECLPSAITTFFGFEIHLDPRLDRTDFALCAFKGEDGLEILANIAAEPSFSKCFRQTNAWKKIQSFCRACVNRDTPLNRYINHVWLEFDIDPSTAGCLDPGFFFGFNRTSLTSFWGPSLNSERLIDNVWLFNDALKTLIPGQTLDLWIPTLAVCLENLPPSLNDLKVGILFSRRMDFFRLWLGAIPISELFIYLQKLRWADSLVEFEKLVKPYLKSANNVFLNLDVGAVLYPRIGIECYMGHLLKLGDRETELIHQLALDNLCSSEKMKALLEWPGKTIERFEHCRGEATLRRALNHIKLGFKPGRSVLEAKAYLLCHINML